MSKKWWAVRGRTHAFFRQVTSDLQIRRVGKHHCRKLLMRLGHTISIGALAVPVSEAHYCTAMSPSQTDILNSRIHLVTLADTLYDQNYHSTRTGSKLTVPDTAFVLPYSMLGRSGAHT